MRYYGESKKDALGWVAKLLKLKRKEALVFKRQEGGILLSLQN